MEVWTFSLAAEASAPLYEQLYAQLKREILEGRLLPGTRLPSKRRMAERLQVSRNTVQAGYEQLTEEGYVVSRPRSGYFVCSLENRRALGGEPSAAVRQTGKASAACAKPSGCRFDFSWHGVDAAHFPFTVWRRLCWEVFDADDPTLLAAGDPQGDPALREAIAAYLHASRGVNGTAEQIVIGSGTESLYAMLIQLLEPRRRYALENPGYEKLGPLFQSSRAAYAAIPLDENGMQPEALRSSGADIACVTPSHQFPTGVIMPVSRRLQLLNWAAEQPGRYLVEDDYDSEFKYVGRPIPALQGLDTAGRVVYMGTFSKSLAPSLRVSYMVLPATLLARYRQRLPFYQCPVPAMEQRVLIRFLQEGYFERHLNRMRVLYRKKREALEAALQARLPQAEVTGANAGLHLLLRLGDDGRSEEALRQAAWEHGVRVYGLRQYDTGPREDSPPPTLLLGYATLPLEEIPAAVERLAQAWRT